MNILWFGPLPPARTDIAGFSDRILSHFPQSFEIERLDDDCWIGELEARPLALKLNSADFCVYNIGNNPIFHSRTLEIASVHPGIVILHDRSLQDLWFARCSPDQGSSGGDKYRRLMGRWYGQEGREAADAVRRGERSLSDVAPQFPLFEPAIENALGVVVHNPTVADEITCKFPGMPVLALPLPYPTSITQTSIIAAPLTTDNRVRLLIFGHIGANRRLVEIVRAWAGTEQPDRFELHICGQVGASGDWRSTAEAAGLEHLITEHGFLSDEDLDQLIRSAHLVLNLRFPTMGEASGSQLRSWANGAVTAVSDVGWYALLPDDSVIKIQPDSEHVELIALMNRIRRGGVDRDAIVACGLKMMTAHDPRRYALKIADWMVQERKNMFRRWTERSMAMAVAKPLAEVLPFGWCPAMPARLFD